MLEQTLLEGSRALLKHGLYVFDVSSKVLSIGKIALIGQYV
jgi:hypothetical protein